MNLNKALNYVYENHEAMIEKGESILGVAYTPDESEADFYIAELSLGDDKDYLIHLGGGYIGSSSGVEDFFSGDNIEDLLKETPNFMSNIQYFLSKEGECIYDISEYALKQIFPELPDPDDATYSDVFKRKAIEKINSVNNV